MGCNELLELSAHLVDADNAAGCVNCRGTTHQKGGKLYRDDCDPSIVDGVFAAYILVDVESMSLRYIVYRNAESLLNSLRMAKRHTNREQGKGQTEANNEVESHCLVLVEISSPTSSQLDVIKSSSDAKRRSRDAIRCGKQKPCTYFDAEFISLGGNLKGVESLTNFTPRRRRVE